MKKRIKELFSNPLQEARLDRKGLKIHRVCIHAAESRNRRDYSSQAMDDIIHLVKESGRSYVDHQDLEDTGQARGTRELLGRFIDPFREGQKLYADLDILSHQAEWMFDIAERFPELVGFSIDGEADITPEGGREGYDLVERVIYLNSTDLVSNPATTVSLFEGEENIDEALSHNSTLAEGEPSWGSMSKTSLPKSAFARKGENKSDWGFPHHWVKGGKVGEDGVFTEGSMFLHRGGLTAAWAAAMGARAGKKAEEAVISHLQTHRKAIGLNEEEMNSAAEKYIVEEENKLKTQKMEAAMNKLLLRILEKLGVDIAGLVDADEESLAKAVDSAIDKLGETDNTEDEKIKGLEKQVETLEGEKTTLETEKQELRVEVDKHEAKEKQEKAIENAKQAIEEAKIPERLISEIFVKLIADTEDEEARKALLDERKEIADNSKVELNLGQSREEREGEEVKKEKEVTDEDWAKRLRRAAR